MRSRRLLLLIAVASALAVVFATVLVSNLGGGSGGLLRERQMERVVPGMTRVEVEALLGGPPGDYCRDPERFSIDHHSITQIPHGFNINEWVQLENQFWRGNEFSINVWFGADGRVKHRRIIEAIDTQPPVYRRVAAWLREHVSRVSPW